MVDATAVPDSLLSLHAVCAISVIHTHKENILTLHRIARIPFAYDLKDQCE